MTDETIETRIARVWLGEDGIVRVIINPKVEISEADAVEVTQAGRNVIGGRKRPFLTDISQIKSITGDARAYFSGPEAADNCRATAVVVKSAVSRTIGNFFLGLNRPPFPVRLFDSQSKAMEWLATFVEPA